MANFKEHVIIGTLSGGFAATSLLVANQADPQAVILYLAAAIVGSILPDIDADNSTTLHMLFSLGAILLAFFTLFSQVTHLSVIELLLLWLLVYLFFKLAVFELFIRATVHRGVFHSLPAAVMFGFVMAILMFRLFQFSEKVAWLAGGFVGFGYLTHLLLDELYSLNLFGQGGVKHSLGSAFKLYSQHWPATITLYVITIGLYFLTPAINTPLQETFSSNTWQVMQERLWPKSGWFGHKL